MKYRDKPEILESIGRELISGLLKLENGLWQEQWKILERHGHGSIHLLPKGLRDKFMDMDRKNGEFTHDGWQDAADIYAYLMKIEHG